MILFDPSQVHFFRYSFSLLFIMIIMLFFITTPVYVGQKNLFGSAYASSNATTRTDPALVFFLTNPTGNFNATGSISSLIVSNRTADPQYVLAGDWNVLASNGNISEFKASFTMVSVNGTERHIHSITNFASNVVAPLILDRDGTTFTGESDMTTDGSVTWHAIQTTVTIAEHDAIKITLDDHDVGNHFQNQAIYGVVFSIQEHGSPQQ
jgi:hypothetical protein